MKKIFFLLVVISLGNWNAFAQKDRLKEANKMFERYAFIDAQKIYLEVANAGYKSENLFKKLGDSYYFNSKLKPAEKWYAKLFELNPKQEKKYIFRYAQSLKSIKKYDKADALMLKYEDLEGEDSRVKRLKKEPDYLQLIEMQSGKLKLDSMSVNSKLSDFAPKVINDTLLVFASNRKQSSTVQRIHEWNNQPYLDLYQVKIDESLNPLGEVKLLPKIINSKFHESSATYTHDGETIYFTRNNYTDKKFGKSSEGINFLKIYKSRKKNDGSWSKPRELPFCSDEYSVAHPALNKDETRLYFASDMPGTHGMSDIYYVNINSDDTYSAPVNLGDKINTEGKEGFPYIGDNNLLYFSSNGHVGLGGLDIFVVVQKKDGTYGDVFNIGRPINSPEDDFSFYINTKTGHGLFASNRKGGMGSDDIYAFQQTDKLITKCTQYLNGHVRESNTEKRLANVNVKLFDENLNLIDSVQTDTNGNYAFTAECNKRYVVRASKNGFATLEDIVRTGQDYESELHKNFDIQKGSELGVTKAGKGDDLKNLLQLDPVYFALDDASIRPKAEVELQKVIAVLKKYPKMKIDVRSHTDSRAGDAYNQVLSDKRAKATMNYIISKGGIDATRVSGRGYGETQLVNRCANGVDCTEAEHAKNRRSEFIILNENETPESIRSEMYSKVSQKIEPRPLPKQQKKGETGHNFKEASKEIYTVQIAALKPGSTPDFKKFKNVFSHVFPDHFERYFSGVFEKREDAERHKLKIRQMGIKGAFSVGLKGPKRILLDNPNGTPNPVQNKVRPKSSQKAEPKQQLEKTSYDFKKGSKEIYTVQIGALKPGSEPDFKKFKNVFSHVYPDNFERYFSGVFETREKAERHKSKVRQMGVKDAFTVGLKGESRF